MTQHTTPRANDNNLVEFPRMNAGNSDTAPYSAADQAPNVGNPDIRDDAKRATEFLLALFGARPSARPHLVYAALGREVTTEAKLSRSAIEATLREAAGAPVSVLLAAAGEVFFVYRHGRSAELEALEIAPTALISKGDEGLALFALESPVLADDIADLLATVGCDREDAIPLPQTGGWTLVRCDADTHYPLEALQEAFGVEMAPAVPVSAGATFLDARVLSPLDLDAPELQQPMTISVGANFQSKRWRNDIMTKAKAVALLARHPVGKQKDGPGFVLGEIVGDNRRKQAVKACWGIGLDIDVGMPGHEIDAALAELGCLAIRYTTFSHGKTVSKFNRDKIVKWCAKNGREFDADSVHQYLSEEVRWDPRILESAEYEGDVHEPEGVLACVRHTPMEKHRVVVLLAEPFIPSAVAPTHAEGMKKWADVCRGLAKRLGDLPMDNAAVDPSRLFYFPRHAEGKPHETTIHGGPLFDWRTLDLGSTAEAGDDFDRALAEFVDTNEKSKSKSQTPEGRELGRWSIKRAGGFQIVEVIRDYAEDRIRTPGTSKIDLECPFDESHSNPGDPEDRGCFAVNAGDGPSPVFTVRCQHDSCQGKTNLDFLGKMLTDEWFPRDVLEDETYNAVLVEDEEPASPPSVGADIALPPRHFGDFQYVAFAGRRAIARKVTGEQPLPLCAPFEVIGAARYPDRENLREVEFAFENEDSAGEVIRIPADLIPRKDALIAHLRGRGMTFGDPKRGPALVHQVLMATQPEARTLYDRPGYLADGTFILPTGVVVGGDPTKVGLSDRARINAPPVAGTLEGWRKGAAAACNSRSLSLHAGLFAGFTGPLLALAGRGTLVLAFTGTTSQGKTWRQQVGVAVSGPPKPGVGQMKSMNSTEIALEIPLERGSSTIVAFDETAFAEARTVQRLVFLAAGEQGRSRAKRDGEAGLVRSWRGGVVTLSTEVGLAQLLRQEGERQTGGMTVRMIEVDVERDGRLSDAQFKQANAMLDNYGHALPVFLEEVRLRGYVDSPGRLTERAEELIKALAGVDEAPAKRAAIGLGFLGVAAEIAKDAGLVPESVDVGKMVSDMWSGALSSGVAPASPVDRGIAQLVETINARRGTEVFDVRAQEERLNPRDPTREIGCWIDTLDGTDGGERVYCLRESLLGAWSGGAADVRTLTRTLMARKLIVPAHNDRRRGAVWPRWRLPVGATKVVVLRADAVEG